jgi:hypothetical protein
MTLRVTGGIQLVGKEFSEWKKEVRFLLEAAELEYLSASRRGQSLSRPPPLLATSLNSYPLTLNHYNSFIPQLLYEIM